MPISPIQTHCHIKTSKQNSKRSLTLFSLALAIISILPTPATSKDTNDQLCAYSPFKELKYTAKSTHFNYVNKDAPKGGRVRIARIGTFNSLNFLRYPGTTIGSRTQIPLAISDYLFDSFLTKSADEPASYYCLAASKIEVSKDLSKVTFTLNPKAKWHDGKPITVGDVLFTFKILKRQGAPYYRQILRQITASSKHPLTIVYTNGRKGDRNFANLVGTLPIHPKHFWQAGKLTQKTMFLPLGSGPYKISSARAGDNARLTRVKNYWAKDLFSQKGRHNFDEIRLDYYRDHHSALAAYKVGNYDIRVEHHPVTWSKEYQGNALSKGNIKKISVPASDQGDIILLTFNQRRSIFKNRNVRKAFNLLYDFEAANRILFHNLYSQVNSIYGSSELAANGKASIEEQKILNPFLKNLPKDILTSAAPQILEQDLLSRNKTRIAAKLLDEAGIIVKGKSRIHPGTGKPLVISVSYLEPQHQRILLHFARNLKTVGIELKLSTLAPAAARSKALGHDFDMIVLKWTPSMMAGNSESLLWGSRLADAKGSYALAGLKDPALDAAIDAMRRAKTLKSMNIAAKVFDRIFRWQIHAIPLWRKKDNWVSHWQGFQRPKIAAKNTFSIIDRWWYAPTKQSKN